MTRGVVLLVLPVLLALLVLLAPLVLLGLLALLAPLLLLLEYSITSVVTSITGKFATILE